MKFTIEKNLFTNALSSVCDITRSISENDSSRFILRNIKFSIKKDILYLIGTDADTVVKNQTSILTSEEIDEEFMVLGQLIDDIVKKIDDGAEIICDYRKEENLLYLQSGKSKFKITCLTAENFPNFEELEMQNSFKIVIDDFIKFIDKTKFAISDDASKYYLNGLFLESILEDNEQKLYAIGTDGHKLSIINLNYFNSEQNLTGIIIPRKTLPEIRKILLLSKDKEAEVFYSKTKIKIKMSKSIIISKLVDADFPDYKRVIPKDNNSKLICDKTPLIKALNRISTIVNEAHKGIKLYIDKNKLYLEANSVQNGSASEELEVICAVENKIEIAFNSKNLLDIFSQIESDKINILLKDNFTAVIIQGEEENDKKFILMPVRI